VRDGDRSLEWWDGVKARFKRTLISHSVRLANNRRQQRDDIEHKLAAIELAAGSQASSAIPLEELRLELDGILAYEAEGARVRARVQQLEFADKPNAFFLQSEKKQSAKRSLNRLNIAGTVTTEPKVILRECAAFYRELFKEEAVDEGSFNPLFEGLPTLDPLSATACEGFLTVEECMEAIRGMKAGTSPGSDGLPTEFYKEFFHLFGEVFVGLINSAYEGGTLSPTQRHSVITLLAKDGADQEQLCNWRPISLLNIDYKIISKAMHNRLRHVAGEIINIDQTCGLAGRHIADNLHLIRNVIDYCTASNTPAGIVSFDQSKAFDRVSHTYLFECLRRFGFGPSFVSWVQFLYKDIDSSVLANGFISKPFPVGRSVRQGCGLSPLLYALCIEPLAHRIRASPDFKGVWAPGDCAEARVSQYADDTTIMVSDGKSISIALELFALFGRASGAALNLTKTCLLAVAGFRCDDVPAGIRRVDLIKINGVFFGPTAAAANAAALRAKISTSCAIHNKRTLSLFGKAVICNILILSRLWYVGAVAPISNIAIRAMNKDVFRFVWRKTEWVNRLTIIGHPRRGGLGLFSIAERLQAFYVNHIANLLWGEPVKWHFFARYFVARPLRGRAPDEWECRPLRGAAVPPYYVAAVAAFERFAALAAAANSTTTTVKNVYGVFLEQIFAPPHVECRRPGVGFDTAWRALTDSGLTPEARETVWRFVHDVLPVRCSLAVMKLTSVTVCPLCKAQPETAAHLFFECATARVV